jgi:HAD superfamily hydrolase (TIGR01484 family)
MNRSDNILSRIRMFVTDADGTLMGRRPEYEQFRIFRDRINSLRRDHGAVWVVCTGRSLHGYKDIFRPMNMFGIAPDYVIARHAYIYETRTWGFLPHWIWNLRVLWLHWKDDLALRRALPKLKRAVLSHNPFAKVVYSSRQRLFFHFEDEGAAQVAAEILRVKVRAYKYLQLFESPGGLDVRVIPFTKGLAVTELAAHLGVSTAEILVVGDGHNDISMMKMTPPCFTACPSNAAVEVMEAVSRTHGHIASEPNLGGVIEVLSAYETGQIKDQLPQDWVGHDGALSPPRPRRGREKGIGTLLLLLAIVYTTLLVVGNFCNFPGRGMIMKPYIKSVEMIGKMMEPMRR